jgi:hypothetical protein
LARRGAFALTLLGTLCSSSYADVVNGLFKGGTLAPWTTTGGATWVEDPPAGGGDGHAQLIAGSITQNGWQCDDDIHPGMNCVLSFSYTATLAAGADAVEVTFRTTGGSGPATVLKGTDGQKRTMTLTSSGCDIKDLTFSNVIFGGTVQIDNVTSTCVAAPEPATLAMIGFGALAFLRKRK